MKILDFNERLKNSILIADGAMGSMLHEAVGAQRCFVSLVHAKDRFRLGDIQLITR